MSYARGFLALQIAALILLVGCRREPTPTPVVETPPQRTEGQTATEPPAKEEDSPPAHEPVQTTSVTDLAGNYHEGVAGDPPGDALFGGVIFRPSQITETDSSAYSIKTSQGEIKSMTFVTERPAFEVKEFYMQKLAQAIDAGNSIEGRHNGRRIVVLLSGGTPVTFEIQLWLP